jgi:hypothetical protein
LSEVPGYYWFRHADGSTFIAHLDDDVDWFVPAVSRSIPDIEEHATLLGLVPRVVVGGGSVDH